MRNNQQPTQDEEFSVFLSRKDYQQLKKCRDDYQHLKAQFEAKTKMFESQKNAISQRYQCVAAQVKRITKQKQEIDELVGRTYSILNERHSKLRSKYDPELTLDKNKQYANTAQNTDKSLDSRGKLMVTMSLMEEAFEVFGLALEKENDKIANLIREAVGLKQENFRLKEEISEKDDNQDRSKKQLEQGKKKEQKYKLELSQIKSHIQHMQQTHSKQQKQQSSLIFWHQQQLQSLQKKITTSTHQIQQLKKQILLIQQQNMQFRKQNNDLQDLIKQYQQHISILKQKEAHKQKERKLVRNTKFQQEDYIKETLVEYMREIRKNLISIGNLSQQEIRQIGTSQLRTLIKFIQELQEDFE